MKKRFLFVCAVLCALTITGCKEKENKTDTLSAPQQITVMQDNGKSLIIFDEVANAQYYNIYIDDVSVTVKATGTGQIQFDASKIISLPQKYTIKIKASGNNYFDSEFTDIYEYTHQLPLDTPVLKMDGTTLNWDKIDNAQFYDVVVKTTNPTTEKSYRVTTNRFEFANLLTHVGDYTFKVRADSGNEEYLTSSYSNQVTYKHKQTLITPHSLKVDYVIGETNKQEAMLSFVASPNVTNFKLNINGSSYNFGEAEFNYLLNRQYENVYSINLSSFAKHKEIKFDNENLLTVSVQAISDSSYFNSSDISNTISCQLTTRLETPRITGFNVTGTTCQIQIATVNSPYLSAFAIYLNGERYKTVNSSVRVLELPLTEEILNSGIRIQAISNNNNCCSSGLSDVRYAGKLTQNGTISASFSNGVISWNSVDGTSAYCIEIYNTSYSYLHTINDTSITQFDISSLCVPGAYSIKVIAMVDGHKQIESNQDIQHLVGLSIPTNIELNSDTAKLHFDEVDNAYGYILNMQYQTLDGQAVDAEIPYLFTSSPINLTPYITEASGYTFKIKSVWCANSHIIDSAFSAENELQSIKTLSTPQISIIQQEKDYYLKILSQESEKMLISGYDIWIDYISIGDANLVDGTMKITSYLTSAGQHNIMVKAKAIDSPFIKDSNTVSKPYDCYKQLEIVTNIAVTKLEEDSKYILTFDEQTLAAQYKVTIVKADDDNYNVEFSTSRGVADISQYVTGNGIYRVYVQAVAREGGFYLDSATTGNPYRLVKAGTLLMAGNINVDKVENSSQVNLTWDKVENCSGYRVEIYYSENNISELKQLIYVPQSSNPNVNIGSGEYLSLGKEGAYTIKIKALSDSDAYESSQASTATYAYTMEYVTDFERNIANVYNKNYTHKVTDAESLKNLIWYHYLYNQNIWNYNTLQYNLKVYCDIDLNTIASQISTVVANRVAAVSSNADKMNIIATELLRQYPEPISYTLGYTDKNSNGIMCLNEQANIYIFNYRDNTDTNKAQTLNTTNKIYKDRLNEVDVNDLRNENYVFAIDNKEYVNVTTTEQLFTALQYDKQPKFVGQSSVAEAVYLNARYILRQICGDNMTDYEKVVQINDFLSKRITFNNTVAEQVTLGDNASTNIANLKDLYLEGILYNYLSIDGLFYDVSTPTQPQMYDMAGRTAVSQGIAKAFVVMCAIEGIDSIKVNGIKNGSVHAWNKVYIDIPDDNVDGKNWYVVDIASAIQNNITVQNSSYQINTHQYFLIKDSQQNATILSYHKPFGDNHNYEAKTDFDYYSYQTYSGVYHNASIVYKQKYVASKAEDVEKAIIYAMLSAGNKDRVVIDLDAEGYLATKTQQGTINIESVKSEIKTISNNVMNNVLNREYLSNTYFTIVDNRYIVLAVESVNYVG